ncbi:MAG: alginate export family protein [Leptospiraceae bacterium]|nr:alginate export family protein [Leptospiraceae bacterium]
MLIGLVPLTAQTNTEREKKLDQIIDFMDHFDLIGQVRVRPEKKSNYDFDKHGNSCSNGVCSRTADEAEFIGQKVQVGFDFVDDGIKARVLLQDSRVWGGETGSPTGLNTANSSTNQSTDVREAWLEFGGQSLQLQAGRQILAYGDQRLVGHLDWTNVGRSFDALRLKYSSDFFDSHLWAAALAEEDSDSAGNNTSSTIKDAWFTGWYNTIKPGQDLHIEAYLLGKHLSWQQATNSNMNPTVALQNGLVPLIQSDNRTRDQDNLFTLGSRITNRTHKGKAAGHLDWTVEYAAQGGQSGRHIAADWDTAQVVVPLPNTIAGLYDATYNPCRVYGTNTAAGQSGCRAYLSKEEYDAWAAAANAGYKIDPNFRLGAEVAVASGDPNRNDSKVATFHNLFHTNHLHYGQADFVSWQNMIAKSVNLTWELGDFGSLYVAYWHVKKHRLQDDWYKVTGGGASGATHTTTESAANSKYGSTYNSNGTINSLGVAYLGEHLFDEYDLRYTIKSWGVEFQLGYSLVLAGDAVRKYKDNRLVKDQLWLQTVLADIQDGQINNPAAFLAWSEQSFDPRAQFAYIQMTYKF